MRVILLVIALMVSELGFSQTGTYKQFLDSVITSGQYGGQKKACFTYDNYGNNMSEISYYRAGTTWLEDRKYEYAYDANKRKIMEIFYYWHSGYLEWTRLYKEEYTYDNRGNQTALISYYWDGYSWKNDSKEESTYDKNGYLLFTYFFEWENAWKMVGIIENSYDIDDNLTKSIESKWNNTVWVNVYKEEYTYDANKNQISLISYHWTDTIWTENKKDSSEYDVKGNLLTNIRFDWNDTNWAANEKDEYVYDTVGNRLIYTSYYWKNTAWVGDRRFRYAYDTNKNLVMYRYYDWSGTDWVENFKYEFTYDLSYSKTDLIIPNDFGEMNNKLLLEVGYDWEQLSWVANEIITYYWSNRFVGIVEANSNRTIQVFPNPTEGLLRITGYPMSDMRLSDIQIYDIVGRKQHAESNTQNGEIEIDISHLVNGIYFLKVGGKVVKVVKQ